MEAGRMYGDLPDVHRVGCVDVNTEFVPFAGLLKGTSLILRHRFASPNAPDRPLRGYRVQERARLMRIAISGKRPAQINATHPSVRTKRRMDATSERIEAYRKYFGESASFGNDMNI